MRHPRAALVAAAAIWGTIGLFARNVPLGSGELALLRAVLAIGMLGIVLLATRQGISLKTPGPTVGLLAASGAAMGFNWILLFEAYRHTTVSVATLSYYTAPILVAVASPLLFKERPGRRQMLCFAMATLGIVLITGASGAGGSDGPVGILFGLGAAVLYAAVMLLNKLIGGVGGIQRTFLQLVAAAAVLAPYVLLTGGVDVGPLDATGWACLLALGLIHTGLAYCLYFPALKELPGQKAAILSYIDPLVAVAISVAVLGEPMSAPQVIGGALILGFTLFSELAPNRRAGAGQQG